MEDMRAELDSMSQLGRYWRRFLPPGGVTDRMLPAIRQEFRVDIREHDGEVIVVADLPGLEKDDVSLQFLNPRILEISCERKGEKEEKSEGYYVRERIYGSMQRWLPCPQKLRKRTQKPGSKTGSSKSGLTRQKFPRNRV
jgi:HSP20 family protein